MNLSRSPLALLAGLLAISALPAMAGANITVFNTSNHEWSVVHFAPGPATKPAATTIANDGVFETLVTEGAASKGIKAKDGWADVDFRIAPLAQQHTHWFHAFQLKDKNGKHISFLVKVEGKSLKIGEIQISGSSIGSKLADSVPAGIVEIKGDTVNIKADALP